MPFKSQAQRRKFYALKAEGKMSQEKIDEWQKDTPSKLPERIKKASFIEGFEKKAGKGFFSGRKSNTSQLEFQAKEGIVDPAGTTTDKTMRDLDRGPKDYNPFSAGIELQVESNPHIRY